MNHQKKNGQRAVVWALLGTLALGAYLRWVLAGAVTLWGDFAHLRHAHSHLGYFGVLFPLSWVAWGSVGAPTPGRRVLWVYGAATLLSLFGFVRAGYGPEAIVGSSVVGAIWLISAWPLRKRWRSRDDLLAMMFWGVLAALLCIPPIGALLRREPALAQAFVTSFLSVLLFAVVVPSCLANLKARPGPWYIFLAAALLGSLALGAWPSWWARGGLLLYGVMLALGQVRAHLAPVHLRLAWGAVGLGVAALALGLLPNTRLVAIGALHFLIPGPILATLIPQWWHRSLPAWAWAVLWLAVSALSSPLILSELGAGGWTFQAAAWGGLATILAWVGLLWWQWSSRDRREA